MNRFDSAVFLENIEWFDETGQELVHRLPETGSGEIKWGAQLTVRESQAAVLFYKGKACDAFGPGCHTLKTGNLPSLDKGHDFVQEQTGISLAKSVLHFGRKL